MLRRTTQKILNLSRGRYKPQTYLNKQCDNNRLEITTRFLTTGNKTNSTRRAKSFLTIPRDYNTTNRQTKLNNENDIDIYPVLATLRMDLPPNKVLACVQYCFFYWTFFDEAQNVKLKSFIGRMTSEGMTPAFFSCQKAWYLAGHASDEYWIKLSRRMNNKKITSEILDKNFVWDLAGNLNDKYWNIIINRMFSPDISKDILDNKLAWILAFKATELQWNLAIIRMSNKSITRDMLNNHFAWRLASTLEGKEWYSVKKRMSKENIPKLLDFEIAWTCARKFNNKQWDTAIHRLKTKGLPPALLSRGSVWAMASKVEEAEWNLILDRVLMITIGINKPATPGLIGCNSTWVLSQKLNEKDFEKCTNIFRQINLSSNKYIVVGKLSKHLKKLDLDLVLEDIKINNNNKILLKNDEYWKSFYKSKD